MKTRLSDIGGDFTQPNSSHYTLALSFNEDEKERERWGGAISLYATSKRLLLLAQLFPSLSVPVSALFCVALSVNLCTNGVQMRDN